MKKPARFLRVLGVVAILVSLIATTVTPAAAQQYDGPDVGVPGFDMLFQNVDPATLAGDNTIYFPWVANDDDFGLGPADTSISVQNLEDRDSQIWIYTGNGDGTWSLATTAHLSRYASKTFTAAQLGLASGEGAPVAVTAFHLIAGETLPGVPAGGFVAETPIILSNPLDGSEGQAQVLACVVNAYTSDGSLGTPYPFVWVSDADPEMVDGITTETDEDGNVWVTWSNQDQLQALLDLANEGATQLINPFGGLNADGDCLDAISGGTPGVLDSVAIGGVAKMAASGNNLPATTSNDTAVSGYNALNGIEVYRFDEWYLPIVQTNCGPGGCWDSTLRVGNVSGQNAAVTIRFFPADDGSGSLQTGFQIENLVNGGDTWHVKLSDLVPEGWVGSAHIYSDGQVFAMVDRFKVGYNMWISNTGSSADYENVAQFVSAGGNYALFAPHVLLDYFGWNTGINVANLHNGDNNISIQYFNLFGNANQVLSQRLAAHGMTYFYDPSVVGQNISGQDVASDPNAGVVGSAIIWSDYPVAAAVDATKYPETDPRGGVDVFQATSYSATQNVYTWQAVPLVQKGSPTTGMGDTSGINMMNPNPEAVTANVYWVNPSGFNAANFGTSSVTIPGFANGFVYTLWQHNLPNGFSGAAQVIASQPIVAVSANVNYEVDGDGSAIFNAFNPCGLYRTPGECFFGDPFEPGDQSVTKTFVDTNGDPVAGVGFQIISAPGTTDFPYQRDGVSGLDGSETFFSVPVGIYDLHVTSVPAGYAPIDPAEVQETFIVMEGAQVNLENILEFNQGFLKTVIVAGSDIDDSPGVPLAGVNVAVYTLLGDGPVVGEQVFSGLTDENGQVGELLAPGEYVLCLYDEDGIATLPSDEEVPVLLDATTPNDGCEVFELLADVDTELTNPVELDGTVGAGVMDISVFGDASITSAALQQNGSVPAVDISIELDTEQGTTDENGWVSFTGLNDGTYTITFEFSNPFNSILDAFGGLLNASNVSVDGNTITFDYSITDDVAQDGVLADTAEEGTADLNVEILDPFDGELPSVIKGWYDTDTDEPVSGVEFCLAEPGSTECIEGTETVSGASGIGAIPAVDPGTYDLVVTAWPDGSDYGDTPYTADTELEITTNDPLGILNVLPIGATPDSDFGVVIKQWYDLALQDVVPGVEFCLATPSGDPLECVAGTETTSDADGIGVIEDAEPGIYNLVVTAWPEGSAYEAEVPGIVDTGIEFGSNTYLGIMNLLPTETGDGGPTATFIKTFEDENEVAVEGVEFCVAPVGSTGAEDCVSDGVTGADGTATLTVPADTDLELWVTSVPDGYALPDGAQDIGLNIPEGETEELTNTLETDAGPTGPPSIVKGWVDYPDGVFGPAATPVAGVEFCLTEPDSTECIDGTETTSGADGVGLLFDIPEGTYDLVVTAWPDGANYDDGLLPYVADEDIEVVEGEPVGLLNVIPPGTTTFPGQQIIKMWYDIEERAVVENVQACALPATDDPECPVPALPSNGFGIHHFPVMADVDHNIIVHAWPVGSDYEPEPPLVVDTVSVPANGLVGVMNLLPLGEMPEPTGTVEKTFLNEDDDPVQGVGFCIAPAGSESADDCVATGTTGASGVATIVAPVGLYDLFVTAVPVGYNLPIGPQDPGFEITEDETTPLSNTLEFAVGVGTFVKNFVDTEGEAVTGVTFTITMDGQDPISSATATEGPLGTYTFAGIPSGVYDLEVTAVPDGYELPTGVQETFRVMAGGSVELTNTLFLEEQADILLIGLNADLNLLGLTDLVVDVYAVPSGASCDVAVGDPALLIAADVALDSDDFIGLHAQVAALDLNAEVLAAFGVADPSALINLGICLAVSAELLGGGVLATDIVVPATISAVGDNYVANAQLSGTSVNLSLLSALTTLVPAANSLLDVTIYENPTGGSCNDTSGMTVLAAGGVGILSNILPINVCIEVELDVLGIISSTAVIGVDLSDPTPKTLQVGLGGLPFNPHLVLTLT